MYSWNEKLRRSKLFSIMLAVIIVAMSVLPTATPVFAGTNPPLIISYGLYDYSYDSAVDTKAFLLSDLTQVPCAFEPNIGIGIIFATNVANDDQWSINSTAFHMYDANNNSISIKVDRAGDVNNKAYLFVVPLVTLQPASTYKILIDPTLTSQNTVQAGVQQEVDFTTAAGVQTATPAITGTPTAGDTSVSGTAVMGASVVLRLNGQAQAPVTASDGTWTVVGLTLAAGDSLSVTAQATDEDISEAVTAIVAAAQGQTATPVITGTPTAGDTGVSGTAVAGASVVLSLNGQAQAPVIAADGTWTVVGLTLAAGDSLSVTAIITGETISNAFTATVAASAAPAPTFKDAMLSDSTVVLEGLPADATNLEYRSSIDGSAFGDWSNLTVAGIAATISGTGLTAGTSKVEIRVKAGATWAASVGVVKVIIAAPPQTATNVPHILGTNYVKTDTTARFDVFMNGEFDPTIDYKSFFKVPSTTTSAGTYAPTILSAIFDQANSKFVLNLSTPAPLDMQASLKISNCLADINGVNVGYANLIGDITTASGLSQSLSFRALNSLGKYGNSSVTPFPSNSSSNVPLNNYIGFWAGVPLYNPPAVLSNMKLLQGGQEITVEKKVNNAGAATYFYIPTKLQPSTTYTLSTPLVKDIYISSTKTYGPYNYTFTTAAQEAPLTTAKVNITYRSVDENTPTDQITLNWTDVKALDPTVTGYNVYWSTDPNWAMKSVTPGKWIPADDDGIVGLNISSADLGGTTSGSVYLRIAPKNAGGEGVLSAPIKVNILLDTVSPTWAAGETLTVKQALGHSMKLLLPLATDNVADLSYCQGDPNNNYSVEVYKKDSTGTLIQLTKGTQFTSNFYADSSSIYYNDLQAKLVPFIADVAGLDPLTTYTFKVRVKDNCNNWSTYLTLADVTTLEGNLPTWPADAAIEVLGTTEYGATLQWTPATDDTGVTAYRFFDGTEWDENGIQQGQTGAHAWLSDTHTIVAGKCVEMINAPSGHTFTYNLYAFDAAGNKSKGPQVTFTMPYGQAPVWPEGAAVTVEKQDGQTVTLSWTKATDDVAVNGYDIYCQGCPMMSVNVNTAGNNEGKVIVKLTGLEPLTTYNFEIKARDKGGKYTATSLPIQFTTTDFTRSNWLAGSELTATNVTASGLTLSWKEPIVLGVNHQMAKLTYYRVYCDNQIIATIPYYDLHFTVLNDPDNADLITNMTTVLMPVWYDGGMIGTEYCNYLYSYDLSGLNLEPNKQYTFKVDVLEAGGDYGYGIQPDIWSTDGPSTSIMLDTTAPVITVDPYTTTPVNTDITVTAKTNEGTLNADSHIFTENGSFDFIATDAADNKTTVTVTITNIDKTAPVWNSTVLNATNITQTSLTLTWDAATDDAGISGYKVYQDGNPLVTVTDTTYNVTGLVANTSYTFKVEAGDAVGNWTTTGPSKTETTLAPLETIAPTWSKGKLTAKNIGETSLELTWSGAKDNVGVTDYNLYMNGSFLVNVLAGTSTTTTYNVTGLSDGTKYSFKVEAIDAAKNMSNRGPSTTATTLDVSAPTWIDATLTTSNITSSSVTLNWGGASDNVGVTSYKIYNGDILIATVSVKALSYTVKRLKGKTDYTFTVQAGDAAGKWTTNGPTITVKTL